MNKKKFDTSHQFAFYYQDLSQLLLLDGRDLTINSDELYHRLKHVIRIKKGTSCILFNQKEHVTFVFKQFEGKNSIVGSWECLESNQTIEPKITFILPLLKIEALSEAIYLLAEVGVTNIQLVSTEKTQGSYSQKLFDKLHRVIIAAAEQSKMYAFPTIISLVTIQDLCTMPLQGKKYYFDMQGLSFDQWYQAVQNNEHYYLFVGPEGDLTLDEKKMVADAGFMFCVLTPTVLRSVRAVSIASALFRC